MFLTSYTRPKLDTHNNHIFDINGQIVTSAQYAGNAHSKGRGKPIHGYLTVAIRATDTLSMGEASLSTIDAKVT